jgi:hypothetical protein
VRCEFRGWDWTKPDEEAVKHYPLFFGPKADKEEYKRQLPKRLDFYSVLPWQQPYSLLPIVGAMVQQGLFGAKTMAKSFRKSREKKPKPDTTNKAT